jgi:hypothetical protein
VFHEIGKVHHYAIFTTVKFDGNYNDSPFKVKMTFSLKKNANGYESVFMQNYILSKFIQTLESVQIPWFHLDFDTCTVYI